MFCEGSISGWCLTCTAEFQPNVVWNSWLYNCIILSDVLIWTNKWDLLFWFSGEHLDSCSFFSWIPFFLIMIFLLILQCYEIRCTGANLFSFRFPWHWSSPSVISGKRRRLEGKDLKKMYRIFRSWYVTSFKQCHLGSWPAVWPIKVEMRSYCTWLSYETIGSNTERYKSTLLLLWPLVITHGKCSPSC